MIEALDQKQGQEQGQEQEQEQGVWVTKSALRFFVWFLGETSL